MNKVKGIYSNNYHRNRRYVFMLVSAVLFGIICCIFGVDDKEAMSLYLQKLQSLSEHKISQEQFNYVSNFYVNNTNRHPIKPERAKVRKAFNRLRPKLRSQWELKYKIVWPELFITKKRVAKHFKFQAHHIVPINAGGINQWWNLTPLTPRNHRLLHNSIEEHACFSHNIIKLKFLRFILMIVKLTNIKTTPTPYKKPNKFKLHYYRSYI